ncbi:MAG: 50S ribosomal protein L25 [Planctomycetota bacterium]
MSDTLTVTAREKVGKRNNQRLRDSGHVPAVLYGHKEESLSLSVPRRQLEAALRHKAKVVSLDGDQSGQAIVQALQWDTFHRDLLHIDLLRVSKGEKVTVTIPVELKGDAPGAMAGGVVEHLVQTVEIEAAPASIPEVLHVDISGLNLGDTLPVGTIADLPSGATLLTDKGDTLVRCLQPMDEPSLDDASAGIGAEPEVIGEKDKTDE